MEQTFQKDDILMPNGSMKTNFNHKLERIKEVKVLRVYSDGTFDCTLTKGTSASNDYYTSYVHQGETLRLREQAFKLLKTPEHYSIY